LLAEAEALVVIILPVGEGQEEEGQEVLELVHRKP
jgi:hypothetical protein